MNFKERAKELVEKMTLDEKMSQTRYDSPAIPRLGIPAYNWWNEALHGVARSGAATVFPQAIGMAASFNTELVGKVADAISDEARAKYNQYKTFGYTDIYQGLTFWSPNINIFRDPRWGRGHETYGEDPLLTGKIATAFIKGLQGELDGKHKYRKLDATVKHYAVHSGPEADRHSFDVYPSKTDLYDTYLYAFKYCIDNADPSAVMGAYNRVYGEPSCGSKLLLEDILRGEFGFEGYVVSDCGAIADFHQSHCITKDYKESAALAMNMGCDLNCGSTYVHLREAYDEGLVTEETVTRSVERLFEARFRLGMFDSDCEYDNIPYDVVECEKHTALNKKMADESIVLLKNDGILPLDEKSVKTVAVIGPAADSKSVLLANYNGTPSKYATLLRGIQDGFCGRVIYAYGCHHFNNVESGAWNEHPTNEAIIAAREADVVIMCMGLTPEIEGEQADDFNGAFSGDKPNIELPEVQTRLLRKIAEVGKPIIFVNVSGSCVNLCEADELCSAVIQQFYPGAEGGNALCDMLFGRTSPSGRLPVTFYRSTEDLPPMDDYSMDNRTYKFFRGNPLYPFGHGLSYASVVENWQSERCVTVENKSDIETDYSVLRYEYVPHKSLVDFKKVHLAPMETVTVTFD